MNWTVLSTMTIELNQIKFTNVYGTQQQNVGARWNIQTVRSQPLTTHPSFPALPPFSTKGQRGWQGLFSFLTENTLWTLTCARRFWLFAFKPNLFPVLQTCLASTHPYAYDDSTCTTKSICLPSLKPAPPPSSISSPKSLSQETWGHPRLFWPLKKTLLTLEGRE